MLKHIEFLKNEVDTNPNTGESKEQTIIDAYFYEDNVQLWGWGTLSTHKYNNRSINDIVETTINLFVEDGFNINYESELKTV